MPALASGKWKENKLKEFIARNGVVATKEEWQRWTISTIDKFDAVGDAWFMAAAESLVISDDTFHQLVNHPVPDVITSDDFKTAVVQLAVQHGCVFPTAADNVTPTIGAAKLNRNYENIIKHLKDIQSQLSGSCAETMETSFIDEQCLMHPLRALRTWKRMSRSFHEIKERRTLVIA
jgi:hypothetical protein